MFLTFGMYKTGEIPPLRQLIQPPKQPTILFCLLSYQLYLLSTFLSRLITMTLNKALLLAATMATVVFGAALNGTDECGSIGPSEELLAVARQMQIDEAAEVKSGNSRHSSKIVVPTYVHVVASGMTKEQGYLLVSGQLIFLFFVFVFVLFQPIRSPKLVSSFLTFSAGRRC